MQKSLPLREKHGLVGITWLACVAYLCGVTIADPDLWGHVLYGLRAIEQGVLVERTDPFSYTAPGAVWVNHEWLTEWQLGWLWKQFGSIGLVLWRDAWVLVVLSIGLWSLRRARAGLAASLLLLVLVTECLGDFVVFVRPQLTTFGMFAVTLAILRPTWDEPHRRGIWLLPVLTAIWTNLHGGFLAGLGMQAVFVFAAALAWLRNRGALNPQTQGLTKFAAVFGLSVAATLVNPYGWHLHGMLWHHLATTQFVREWQPIWSVAQPLVLLVPFVLILIALPGWRRMHSVDWLVLAVVGWQAVTHLRHVALLAVAVLVLLPGPLTDSLARLFAYMTESWSRPQRRPVRVAGTVAVIGFLVVMHIRGVMPFRQAGLGPWAIAVETRSQSPGMPLRAMTFLRENGIRGNLVTHYGWGQCVLWHLFPDSRVAFDGRYRTIYPAALEREFLAFFGLVGETQQAALLDRYPTDVALLPVDGDADRFLATRTDWTCVFRDEQAAVYLANNRPRFQQVLASAASIEEVPRWQAFPGTCSSGMSLALPVAVTLPAATF